jgi:hypothetical protein
VDASKAVPNKPLQRTALPPRRMKPHTEPHKFTIKQRRQIAKSLRCKWALQGSNLRPLDYESTALTD